MKRLFAALAVVCGTVGCKVDLNGTCAKDSDCKSGLSCDSSVDPHVCVSACDPVCGATETCANAKCVSTGPIIGTPTVTDNTTIGLNGFYPRDTTTTIPVSVGVTPGFGGQIASVFLTVNGQRVDPVSNSTTGTTTTYSFSVPTSAQTPGSDAPLFFDVTATDASQNVSKITSTVPLKVDDAGPAVLSITATGPDATPSGVPWFKQLNGVTPLPDIDIVADIVDSGSGLDPGVPPRLVLQSAPATQINSGTATPDGTVQNRWHFAVPRVGRITSGAEGTIAFTVKAVDRFGHSERGSINSTLGVDGRPPDVSPFMIAPGTNYPPVGDGCDADTSLLCGHDGSHFWVRGLGPAGAETSDVTFTPVEAGSGLDPAGGTCAIVGSSSNCITSFVSGHYSFKPNFTGVALTPLDPATGGGKATITVTARDLVGNVSSTANQTADVSRIRWVQQLTNRGVTTLRGSPIATGVPTQQIIVAGTAAAGANAVVSVKPTGGIVWTAGGTTPVPVAGPNLGIQSVSSNMLYDPTSAADPMLYIVQSTKVIAAHVTATGVDKFYVCTLASVAPTLAISSGGAGAHVIALQTTTSAGPPPTTTMTLVGLSGTPNAAGTGCSSINPNVSLTGASGSKFGSPTISGQNVYVGYDISSTDRGVIATIFDGLNFSGLSKHHLGVAPYTVTGITTVSVPDDLFFADSVTAATKNAYRYNSSTFSQSWKSADLPNATVPPVVAATRVLVPSGPPASGQLLGFGKASGTTQVTYPGAGDLGAVSPVATGTDGTLYLTHSVSTTNELLALAPGNPATQLWSLSGPATASLAGVGTEISFDDSGILYVGQDSGNLYAIITDSLTGPALSAGEWPRTGYDRCNSAASGNTGFACR